MNAKTKTSGLHVAGDACRPTESKPGWQARAESEAGHGATFYFSLSQPVQKGA